MQQLSDHVLVAAAQRGDAACFAELVRRHGALVYRVAARLLGDEEDARDCTQEAWIQAWRNLPNFRGASSLPTWLYRVTTNQALMMLRRRRVTLPLTDTDEQRLGFVAATTEEQAETAAMQSIVRRGLMQLSDDHRTVLVLREFEGLPLAEVAHIVGIEVPAAKQRLRRARLALARLLAPVHDAEGDVDG